MIFKRFGRKKSNGEVYQGVATPSLITSDVVVEGNVVTSGELHIDGTVRGHIRARACVVDANGLVEGEVAAEDIYIRGRVLGPIRGVHVHLYAGSHVEGDVINESIVIDNGAYIYGSIRRSEDPLSEPSLVAAPHSPQGSAIDFGLNEDDVYRPIKVVRPR